MTTVDKILTRYRRPSGLAGASPSAAMRKELEAHARRMAATYAALFVVLLLILGALGTAMVVEARACRQVPTELLVGAAAAVAAILEIVRRTVGEWIKAKLVATLCRRLDAVQLDSVLNRLL